MDDQAYYMYEPAIDRINGFVSQQNGGDSTASLFFKNTAYAYFESLTCRHICMDPYVVVGIMLDDLERARDIAIEKHASEPSGHTLRCAAKLCEDFLALYGSEIEVPMYGDGYFDE